jgi:hypothetical protein
MEPYWLKCIIGLFFGVALGKATGGIRTRVAGLIYLKSQGLAW